MEGRNGDLGRPLLVEEKQQHIIWEGFTKYVLLHETMEVLAYRGLLTVLGLFLLESLHFTEESATEAVHLVFLGTCLSSVVGSLVSDAFLGVYRSIYLFSFSEFAGYLILVISAIPDADWQSSAVRKNLTLVALLLVALGFGGMRPCSATFGGNQAIRSRRKIVGDDVFYSSTSEAGTATGQYYSLYYTASVCATLFSSLIFPCVRVHGRGSYLVVFLISSCAMPSGTIFFWLGRKHYRHDPVGTKPPELKNGHSQQEEGSTEISEEVADMRSKAVEEAAEKFPLVESMTGDDWKILISAMVFMSPTIFFSALRFQPSSTWLFQAMKMDGHVPWFGGFNIPPDEMGVLKPIFLVFIIPFLNELVYPFIGKHITTVTNMRKMLVALVMITLSFVMSGVLQVIIDAKLEEKKIGGLTSDYADVSRLWQVPQYVFLCFAEVMMSIPAMEWSYYEAPKSMKTVVYASHSAYQALGNLLTVAVVALIGARVSKATETFVFVGVGALGTVLMSLFTNTFISRESRALQRQAKESQN